MTVYCTCCAGCKSSTEGIKLDQSLLEANKQACCGVHCGFSWRAPAVSHRGGSKLSAPFAKRQYIWTFPALCLYLSVSPPHYLFVLVSPSLFHCQSKPIMYDIFILRVTVISYSKQTSPLAFWAFSALWADSHRQECLLTISKMRCNGLFMIIFP